MEKDVFKFENRLLNDGERRKREIKILKNLNISLNQILNLKTLFRLILTIICYENQ